MNTKKYICPVCGYEELEESPYDKYGCSSFEICPCCGIEFGYHDSNMSNDQLRQKWIDTGMNWHSTTDNHPKDWNPNIQIGKFSRQG